MVDEKKKSINIKITTTINNHVKQISSLGPKSVLNNDNKNTNIQQNVRYIPA